MNVCLIRPPQFVNFGSFSMNPSPPLGLAFIAAALKNAGHSVSVIDAIGEHPTQITPIYFSPNTSSPLPDNARLSTLGLTADEILEKIPPSTQVVGISCMFANNWLVDRFLIGFIGQKLPNVTIIAGGENISAIPELCLGQSKSLKAIVVGEGEETVVDLINSLEKGDPLKNVQGITFRDDNQIVSTPRRNRVKDLEKMPLPDWEQFPLDNYQKHMIKWGFSDSPSLPVMATRGCPYSCTFCSSPLMWGTRYYMRSPSHVADELEDLNKRYGITNFDFYDLTAIIKREWIINFSNEIVSRGMQVKWQIPAGTRSEAIDEEVAKHLYLSGCRSITYAPETGSARLLKLIKKKAVLANMLQSINFAHKQKMHVFINVIIALPDENMLDILKTLWFLVKCSWQGVNEVGIARFWPYPGSELFERLISEKKLDLSSDDYFVNMLLLTAHEKADYYNDSMPRWWYYGYMHLMLITFYSSNFLFRPVRFFSSMKNVITLLPQNRTERAFVSLVKMKILQFNTKLSFTNNATFKQNV